MPTFPHVRLSAEGTLGSGGGNEIWSCSTKVVLLADGASNVPVAATAQDLIDLSARGLAAWSAFIGGQIAGGVSSAYLFSGNVALVDVKAASVTVSGLDDPALDSNISDAVPPVRGGYVQGNAGQAGGASWNMPYPVSLVCTMRGNLFRRGSAAYGRFFMPGPNLSLSSSGIGAGLVNGLMNAESVLGFAEKCGLLLSSINGPAALTSGKIAKVSNIGSSTAEAGLRWQPVTSVTVDNRPDTIRTRSNKIGGQGKQDFVVA